MGFKMIKTSKILAVLLFLAGTMAFAWNAAAGEGIPRYTSAPAVGAGQAEEPIPYQKKQTDGNAMGIVLSNFGFFGNNFVSRAPSMEYPLGSQQDHMVRGGMWFGAINADGDTVVSTGTVSGTAGASGTETASEFTPRKRITERSVLITSRAYSKDAISEQDLLSYYTDTPRKGDNKAPLGIGVNQDAYLWSYRFAEAFVIVSFTIVNESGGLLKNPCFGLYGELSSGWKGQYESWPPSGWFKKKALEYSPEHRMCSEHHYNYDGGRCPSWGAFAILGAEGTDLDSIDQIPVSFNWWSWYWERDTVVTDDWRYELMINGEQDETADMVPNNNDYDAVEVVSVGPFPEMAPGDTIVVVCAYLGGMDRDDLIHNVEWAERAYENDYILPSPPQPPRYKIRPDKGRISIFWDNYPEDKLDPFYQVPDFEGYRIYVTRKEGATTDEFDMVRDLDIVDALGYDTGMESVRDSTVISDTLYTYRFDIDNVKDGFKYWVALTAYDRGMPEEGVETMESGIRATKVLTIPGTPAADGDLKASVVPNPYRGDAVWDGTRDREKYVWFINLPAKATIRIFTLAGDLVKTIDFDGSTYNASDVQGLRTAAERNVAIPGGICAWDLITDEDQAVATGLYIYSIENRKNGSNQLGKFMVIR
jgi:hypothetical protein